jgi:Spy/CpxP family protein refolding chaperone
MKSPIKFTIAALSLGLAVASTQAQDAGAPPPPPGEHGGPHEGMRKGPRGDRLKMLAEKLGLTEDQKAKIKPIVEDEMQAGKAVRDDASLSKEAKQEKMEEIRKTHRAQIRALLTPEQQAKLDELKEEMGRGPGGPRKPKE